MADLNKLVEKIKADTELKKQFASAVKENKVVEFCKGLGVETTKEEIAEFLNAVKKQELSDAELNRVSGGCETSTMDVTCNVILHSVGTAGSACVFESIMHLTDGSEHCIGD